MERFQNEITAVPLFYEVFAVQAEEFGFGHAGRLSIQFHRPSTRHSHQAFQVLTPLAGQGILDLGGKEILLERGRGAVIPPGLEHQVREPAGGGVLEVFNLIVEDDPEKAAGRFLQSLKGRVEIPFDADRADTVVADLEAAFAQDRLNLAPTIVARLWDILALYEKHSDTQTSLNQADLDPHVRIAEAYLHENLHRDLSVEDIAGQVGLSASQLHRLYKKNFDETPHRRLQRMRLALARDLLRYSSLRMNEIAARCGFKDATHFSFLFRKTQGASPKDYRKTHA